MAYKPNHSPYRVECYSDRGRLLWTKSGDSIPIPPLKVLGIGHGFIVESCAFPGLWMPAPGSDLRAPASAQVVERKRSWGYTCFSASSRTPLWSESELDVGQILGPTGDSAFADIRLVNPLSAYKGVAERLALEIRDLKTKRIHKSWALPRLSDDDRGQLYQDATVKPTAKNYTFTFQRSEQGLPAVIQISRDLRSSALRIDDRPWITLRTARCSSHSLRRITRNKR